MSGTAIRTAKVLLWTTAAVSWSWAGVATVARTAADDTAGEATASASAPPVQVAAPESAALPYGEPGSVLVLRLSRPAEPSVIVRREYVSVPAPAARPAARPAPAPQRSSGS